jgi:hypothetical protein
VAVAADQRASSAGRALGEGVGLAWGVCPDDARGERQAGEAAVARAGQRGVRGTPQQRHPEQEDQKDKTARHDSATRTDGRGRRPHCNTR